MRLEGSRVLVTGASSGIGRELSLALAKEGAILAVAARRVHLLEELADEVAASGAPVPVVLAADLARRGAAVEVARRARDSLGGVDVLINNAGGGVGGSQWAVADRDQAREAFEINYWTPLALIGEFVPEMRSRDSGCVVNVTSGAQSIAWPLFGAYAATKAALAAATESLRLELLDSGVGVLEVVVGVVETAVQAETRVIPGIDKMLDLTPMGTPAEVAKDVVEGLGKDRHRILTPRRAGLSFSYAMPRLARRYIERLVRRANAEVDQTTWEALLGSVVRTGSMGDLRDVREEWERAHRR